MKHLTVITIPIFFLITRMRTKNVLQFPMSDPDPYFSETVFGSTTNIMDFVYVIPIHFLVMEWANKHLSLPKNQDTSRFPSCFVKRRIVSNCSTRITWRVRSWWAVRSTPECRWGNNSAAGLAGSQTILHKYIINHLQLILRLLQSLHRSVWKGEFLHTIRTLFL